MNAPSPPPIMPSRIRGGGRSTFSSAVTPALPGDWLDAKHAPDLRLVGGCSGEIIECPIGNANDVVCDELRAFAGTVFGILQAAFPFQDSPGAVADRCQLGKNAAEVDLAVAKRPEAPSAINPSLESRVDALSARWVELCILYVKRLDT